MPPMLTASTCTCAKWRALTDEQRARPTWVIVHHLHHLVKDHRPPFTINRVIELADCSERDAQSVLDEATARKWFVYLPPADGAPGYYLSPTPPKGSKRRKAS
jgi:hypothetical protein